MRSIKYWNAAEKEIAMSIIFGIRKPMGASVFEQELLHSAQATERYSPDGTTVRVSGNVGMGFQPYYTHLRSRLDAAPAHDVHGNLLVLDGRLDNCQELCRELQLEESSTPDSQIILAAFLCWGEESFSRLIGDWALALWVAKGQVLYLARDHAGTRTLYFENKQGTFFWSTYLDSFFTVSRSVEIDEEYAACYLAAQPIRDLTPYKGIRSIPPAHYAAVHDNKISLKPHWNWMGTETIRYRSDQEYDEHFLALFGQAVARRDGPGAPVIAQLSGGMDSTSIVCMSDHIRRLRNNSADLIDTISYYDDSEPGWNEKLYFTAVEEMRGKSGSHIEMSFLDRTFEPHDPSQGLYFLPGADSSGIDRERKVHAATAAQGYRSILSGIGGDEVLGGVPSPKPELANYLITGNVSLLLKRTVEWCVIDRSPFFHTLIDVAKYVCQLYRQPRIDRDSIPTWLKSPLQRACADHSRESITRGNRFGLSASGIGNGLAWWSIMETLPHTYPCILSRPEYRYPFLDKQLVDYLFSIPPEVLVQPGRRRSLMRRALKSIVPEVVLERRRKAYQIRGPLHVIQQANRKLDLLFDNAFLSHAGFIEPAEVKAALHLTSNGKDFRWLQALTRTIAFELWIQGTVQNYDTPRTSPHIQQLLLSTPGANKIRITRVAS
jgi:asparagine synthase (glutamine-hydrolysing)